MKVIGQLEYQGAVFVYKADGTEAEAWQCVQAIHKDHGGIRGELHCDKADFLAGLRAWNEATDPASGFLCIHAHMGAPGVNCISGKPSHKSYVAGATGSLAERGGACVVSWVQVPGVPERMAAIDGPGTPPAPGHERDKALAATPPVFCRGDQHQAHPLL
ncbi:MAG: hypothetical protein GX595_01865 [Lentisphaerae bacterium]|nr:hypothetical protein [Lentisphaerota bacterium]